MQQLTNRRRRSMPLLLGLLGVLSACGISAGGSSDSGSSDSGSSDSGSSSPSFAGSGSLDSSRGSVVLAPEASGTQLDFQWRVKSGPDDRVQFGSSAVDGETPAVFPLVGSYQVEVVATDPAGRQASHDIAVTIQDAAGFTLQMRMADMVAEEAAPLNRLPVRLFWQPFPERPLLQEAADIQGQVRFSGLADDPARYELQVPTN